MNITATVRSSLDTPAVRSRLVQTISSRVTTRFALELEEELRLVLASGRGEDADARREALARAIRRHFGAPL